MLLSWSLSPSLSLLLVLSSSRSFVRKVVFKDVVVEFKDVVVVLDGFLFWCSSCLVVLFGRCLRGRHHGLNVHNCAARLPSDRQFLII